MNVLARAHAPLASGESALRKRLLDAIAEVRGDLSHPGTLSYLDRLRAGVERQDLGLPRFPEVARQLDALLAEDEPDDRKILEAVEREPALVQNVWRISSTAPYTSAPRRLDQAITRVGLDRLWQLGVRCALRSELFLAPGYDDEVARCRRAAVAGAQVASWLAGEGRGSVYLASLLRDLGELWLYSRVVGDGPRDRPQREVVLQLVTTLHTSLTGLALRAWGMGDAVAIPAAFHHTPGKATDHKGSAAFVGLADVAVQAALDPERRAAAAVWLQPWLGDGHQVTRVLKRARSAIEQAP